MLKSVEGIYSQGKVVLEEKPEGVPANTKVIVTFLTEKGDSADQTQDVILDNQAIDKILTEYRQTKQQRPIGLCKGEFQISDGFNEPLPNEILALFE